MANTFTKVYKKIANTGQASDYTLAAEVGVGGVPLQVMGAATSGANGVQGLVPAPSSGEEGMFLKANGTWDTPTNTTYDLSTIGGNLAVESGGTGASSFASGTAIVGNGTSALSTREITDSITSESSSLLTSGGIYSKLGLASSENFTVNGTTYATVKAAIDALNSKLLVKLESYIGMIIHSTTLDTAAKVIAIYGGTTWIQHSGYVLRGATSGVSANSASKTGGNDDLIVPYHTHTQKSCTNPGNHYHHMFENANSSNHNFGSQKYATSACWSGNDSHDYYIATTSEPFTNKPYPITDDSGSHTHTITLNAAGTSGNTTNANLPKYKSVYIWERTA